MWLFSWHGTEIEPVDALRQTALFAALFGLLMASSIGIRRKQLKLTPWEQLAPTTTTPTIHE